MKYILLAVISLIVFSCEKKSYNVQNLKNGNIELLGHGGMGVGFKYPINSSLSVSSCMEINADGTELDIQLSKDSVLVAYHNNFLSEDASCEGLVNQHDWQNINHCRYSSIYSNSLQVMSLRKLFEENNSFIGKTIILDCKLYFSSQPVKSFFMSFARSLQRLYQDFDGVNIIVETTSKKFVASLKKVGYSGEILYNNPDIQEAINVAFTNSLYGISSDNAIITSENIKEAHKKGLYVSLFGVTSKRQNRSAIKKSPDFIQSDKIVYLLKEFEKYKTN